MRSTPRHLLGEAAEQRDNQTRNYFLTHGTPAAMTRSSKKQDKQSFRQASKCCPQGHLRKYTHAANKTLSAKGPPRSYMSAPREGRGYYTSNILHAQVEKEEQALTANQPIQILVHTASAPSTLNHNKRPKRAAAESNGGDRSHAGAAPVKGNGSLQGQVESSEQC